jgi:hypothetical protein
MKDAKGHGSNPRGAHADGTNKVGEPLQVRKATPQEFLAAQAQTPRGAYLTPHTPEELANHTLLMTPDGKAGVFVAPDGYIGGLFNNSGVKGVGGQLFEAAKARGGNHGDYLGDFLANLYKSHGFKETARYPFDPKLAPANWDYAKYGKPDYVEGVLPPRAERRREKLGRI